VQKKWGLESLMFLEDKRDGMLMGWTYADGQNQREAAKSGDATSPTVSLESLLITATIDIFERRDVAVVDVSGVFLSADMDEEVITTLRDQLAELMVKTAPNKHIPKVYHTRCQQQTSDVCETAKVLIWMTQKRTDVISVASEVSGIERVRNQSM
jgi:hypothetical protein